MKFEELQIILDDWYMRGFNGEFKPEEEEEEEYFKGVFHSIDNLRELKNGNFLFNIDWGSADIDKAISALEYELEQYGYIVERKNDTIHDIVELVKM